MNRFENGDRVWYIDEYHGIISRLVDSYTFNADGSAWYYLKGNTCGIGEWDLHKSYEKLQQSDTYKTMQLKGGSNDF